MRFAAIATLLFSALAVATPVDEDTNLKRQEGNCVCPEGYWVWIDYSKGEWGKDFCRNDDGRIISCA
ncbi:unnamed protein product [Clonostachys rosea]|uniref:Uncharacterized protein n=1 Tax=Bionectria ochroleuca TaxID=29856 RepID=A0ABY6UE99_BIOOC|nr:unnamed protein product [Clonostachys rosea]